MRDQWPLMRDLVLIGGGHAHALVLRMWAMRPMPGVRLTLVTPGPVAPYTGMLPGLVAGHYTRPEMMIDLVLLAEAAGARLILAPATALDPATRRIAVTGRPDLRYDLASVDVGLTYELPDVPGLADHALSAKPLGAFAERWERFVHDAPPTPQVIVIGAGLGGVELALAIRHRLAATGRQPRVTLIEAAATPLPGLGDRARRTLLARLAGSGVTLLAGTRVARVAVSEVTLADGRTLPADLTLTAAGARPADWLAASGLVTAQGWLAVGPTLQTSDPAVFAAGDCAHLTHAPRPKAGVFAVRAAPVLFHNLRNALAGNDKMRRFQPQRDYLKLVSLGDRNALADRSGLGLSGRWLWRVKDRIDRRFMQRLSDVPAMPRPQPPGLLAQGLAQRLSDRPLCAGCGAKLGADTLAAALSALPPPTRADVVAGRGDDAAVLRAGAGLLVLTTDHLRAFTRDLHLMARIAAIHSLGDVLAMGAAPQAALAQITLPEAAPDLSADMLAEVMAAAAEVFAAAGADVVGGHSTAGAEAVLGFTVTGLTTAATLRRKGGARSGDALILTKPLGIGTILAALMARSRLPDMLLGEAVAAAFASMSRLPVAAARTIAPAASALTDVTGFGLAGHLLEMLDASGCGARLSLAGVPLLPGAQALAAAGHGSSLAPQNRAACIGRIRAPDPSDPRLALLFDPQTGGGLLAAIPAAHLPAVTRALDAASEPFWQIGRIVAGPPLIDIDAGPPPQAALSKSR